MYIIDEFLEVRNAFEKNYIKNEENFLKIRDKIIKNTNILLSNDDDKEDKLIELLLKIRFKDEKISLLMKMI